MRWLITGGCGFIGTSLIHRLRAKAVNAIRVVDNLAVGTLTDLGRASSYVELKPERNDGLPAPSAGSCQFIRGDILNDALALSAAKDVDVIVHLAANTGVGPSVENPRSDCVTNVLGTLNYLEAARLGGVKRFIFASSGAPIGEVEPPIHEELAPHPVSPYGASKLAGEGYCSAYTRTFGLEAIALRFGNVYGPGSTHKNSVIAKFIKQGLAGQAFEIYGDGSQTRDFLYIDDLIDAILKAADAPNIGGEIFQIATHRETTILEVAQELHEVFAGSGLKRPPVRHSESRLGDVQRNFSDTSKAGRVLGWRAQVSLRQGLQQTLSWFLTTGGCSTPKANGETSQT